jgi:hypothetical protein
VVGESKRKLSLASSLARSEVAMYLRKGSQGAGREARVQVARQRRQAAAGRRRRPGALADPKLPHEGCRAARHQVGSKRAANKALGLIRACRWPLKPHLKSLSREAICKGTDKGGGALTVSPGGLQPQDRHCMSAIAALPSPG